MAINSADDRRHPGGEQGDASIAETPLRRQHPRRSHLGLPAGHGVGHPALIADQPHIAPIGPSNPDLSRTGTA